MDGNAHVDLEDTALLLTTDEDMIVHRRQPLRRKGLDDSVRTGARTMIVTEEVARNLPRLRDNFLAKTGKSFQYFCWPLLHQSEFGEGGGRARPALVEHRYPADRDLEFCNALIL